MKDTWKEYFSFNKRQRNGILVLLTLIAILVVYLFIADYFSQPAKPVNFSSFKSELENAGIKPSADKTKNTIISSQIDINSADTTSLLTLPKMTSYCAGMLVRYRKKLGGYYSTKQVSEVWGMDSTMLHALLSKVYADTELVHKININTADVKQLAYHPYIRYYLAKAIVNYRAEHGTYTSLSALHQLVAIDDSTYSKIIPYLTLGSKQSH